MIIKIVRREWLLVLLTMFLLLGCEESKQENKTMKTISQTPTLDWKAFEQKKVVFGHQSVGNNILSGIERLAARDGIKININEQRSAPANNGISHFFIGKNGEPKTKIHDFASAIGAGAAQGADIAMMKLCYVDIDARTDAKQVAKDYIENLDGLSQNYPNTNFLAITVPLISLQTGPRAMIKKIMGWPASEIIDNAKRAEFNTLIRERYLATNQLFDLAKIESESNGKKCRVVVDAREVEALCPELTTDSGHLNENGQNLVAAELINFISSLNSK